MFSIIWSIIMLSNIDLSFALWSIPDCSETGSLKLLILTMVVLQMFTSYVTYTMFN